MVNSIYYTGIGSRKNGKHSVKQFLQIMNKRFNVECSEFIAESEYEPCATSKKMKYNVLLSSNKSRKMKTYKKLLKKCNQYKKTSKRKCNVDEYITFSGAE
jgi:hypothetical protein